MNPRSMCEPALLEALDEYLTSPASTLNERQLAQLCKDLIELTGDQPEVVRYINLKAAEALAESQPWG